MQTQGKGQYLAYVVVVHKLTPALAIRQEVMGMVYLDVLGLEVYRIHPSDDDVVC